MSSVATMLLFKMNYKSSNLTAKYFLLRKFLTRIVVSKFIRYLFCFRLLEDKTFDEANI